MSRNHCTYTCINLVIMELLSIIMNDLERNDNDIKEFANHKGSVKSQPNYYPNCNAYVQKKCTNASRMFLDLPSVRVTKVLVGGWGKLLTSWIQESLKVSPRTSHIVQNAGSRKNVPMHLECFWVYPQCE